MSNKNKVIATNDCFIEQILQSNKHRIERDGTCWIVDRKTKDWRRWDKPYQQTDLLNNSYYYVSFKAKKISVHRIVYAKYIGPLDNTKTINHIDGNPSNNNATNLELVTFQENSRHSWKVLKRNPVIGYKKINPKIAKEIRLLRKSGAKYKELVTKFKLCKSSISYIVNNKTWSK
jgi:hypothetical protein